MSCRLLTADSRAAALLGGLLLAGCGYHGPAAGPVAHLVIEDTDMREQQVEICVSGSWKTVKADAVTLPARTWVRLRTHAEPVVHVHHYQELEEAPCDETFQFETQEAERYKLMWNALSRGCTAVVVHRPESWAPSRPGKKAEEEAESWTVQEVHGPTHCGS